MSAVFVEVREAAHSNHVCVCGNNIGHGDQYKREAIPPWAFHARDEEGTLIDYGEGVWIVMKRCYNCMGDQGGDNGFSSTSGNYW